ncbi:hypothetical protein AW27_031575 [Streptomyces sp. PCS3-D2]|uniref:hypothetical protein n=1 Tax=Streptomyces sp. PCS3-D2 TaxID=1460244 RepID=UPI00045222ED|nr:hypothetical protein [Streptomyces sp. PCS3-D2]WKV75665.1 hypothetical protein AW27_031575 [Streptomyces sp. PCS3-D2]
MSLPGPDTPPEHWRYARYLESLAAVPCGDAQAEAEVVTAVLGDPDRVMAESAVVTHLDRRAAALLADDRYTVWARAMSGVLAGRVFPERRLREWSLLTAVTRGEPWSAADLTGASDWCQRTAVRLLTCHEALELLAAGARTRRVRNAAAERLRRRTVPSSR